MPFAATWMDLEMIILSKTEKGKPHMMSLACGPTDTEIRLQVPWGWGRVGNMGLAGAKHHIQDGK